LSLYSEGKRLEVAKALGVTTGLPTTQPDTVARSNEKPTQPNRVQTLDEVMRHHIESVLTLTRGRIEGRRGAAMLLEINPHTLRARMRKLNIDWTQFRPKEDCDLVL
jgi:transcriptional regulator with GAF, ATPase, and Fis domain